MRILLVEDDKQMAQTVKEALSKYFVTEVAYTGEKAEYIIHVNVYDLIIIDWSLPDIDGLTLCKKIRKEELTMPILMLTGQSETEKKVIALDAGADDYLTKPFRFEELLARIRALLRRHPATLASNTISVNGLSIDTSRKIVKRNDNVIPLRRKEFYLLEYLMRNNGRVITREMIMDHVWDSSNDSVTNVVDVHIKYLRDKIDKPFKKKLIKTVHGIGYKIEV